MLGARAEGLKARSQGLRADADILATLSSSFGPQPSLFARRSFCPARVCHCGECGRDHDVRSDRSLASIRDGEYLFKRPEPSYEVDLDVFRAAR